MSSPYDGWFNRCARATQDIRTIRKLLERLIIANPSEELREAQDCQERIRSLLFFATERNAALIIRAFLTPPTLDDPNSDDEDEDTQYTQEVLTGVAIAPPVVAPVVSVAEDRHIKCLNATNGTSNLHRRERTKLERDLADTFFDLNLK